LEEILREINQKYFEKNFELKLGSHTTYTPVTTSVHTHSQYTVSDSYGDSLTLDVDRVTPKTTWKPTVHYYIDFSYIRKANSAPAQYGAISSPPVQNSTRAPAYSNPELEEKKLAAKEKIQDIKQKNEIKKLELEAKKLEREQAKLDRIAEREQRKLEKEDKKKHSPSSSSSDDDEGNQTTETETLI